MFLREIVELTWNLESVSVREKISVRESRLRLPTLVFMSRYLVRRLASYEACIIYIVIYSAESCPDFGERGEEVAGRQCEYRKRCKHVTCGLSYDS